jgi:catechol 2,3-dioxygenase-like lactoylglutathione lyase family enzyme
VLTHILHTGVEVADLAEAMRLYRSLGFEVANQFDKPEPKAKVATMRKGEAAFELWQFEDTNHPQVSFIRNHVAFYSNDLAADVQTFLEKGYKLVIPITEGVKMRYAFVQDPAGTCYEIASEKESA